MQLTTADDFPLKDAASVYRGLQTLTACPAASPMYWQSP